MFTHIFQLIAIATLTLASSDDCGEGYSICRPLDAATDSTPQIGSPEFPSLYTDILQSTLPTFTSKRRSLYPRSSPSLCCISTLSCLTMAHLFLPFCYDKYTTNYFLPDNSYGTLANGAYNSSSGNIANLQTGDYTLQSGEKGNIYSNNKAEKPNTATLLIPGQWTSSGVGNAIPASGLGGRVTKTYTTTLPGNTIQGTTLQEQTLVTTSLLGTQVVTSTVEGGVRVGTTVGEVVTTVTTTQVGLASSRSSSSASISVTEKNAGGKLEAYLKPWGFFALMIIYISR